MNYTNFPKHPTPLHVGYGNVFGTIDASVVKTYTPSSPIGHAFELGFELGPI